MRDSVYLKKKIKIMAARAALLPGDSGVRQVTSEPCSTQDFCCNARLPASERGQPCMRLPACCGSAPGAEGHSVLEGGQCMSTQLSMAVHSD